MLVYDGAHVLDVAGPFEVFNGAARLLVDRGTCDTPPYCLEMVAAEAGTVVTSSGLELCVRRTYREVGPVDTFLVPGGIGYESLVVNAELISWLADVAGRAERVGSLCTGALLLAKAGLLQGRTVTTHWAHYGTLLRADPTVIGHPRAIYVRDGTLYTSAGFTSGIDLALAMVEEDWGRKVSIDVAKQLVMFLKRPGAQSQVSCILDVQGRVGSRFESLLLWIQDHLDCDLRVAALARHMNMSARSFARHFVGECGISPAAFVMRLRVEAARRYMEESKESLKAIARRTGFVSEQSLRRAFVHHSGPTSHAAVDQRWRDIGQRLKTSA
jgi:transcriptional regulator GlxA family with amidase domain